MTLTSYRSPIVRELSYLSHHLWTFSWISGYDVFLADLKSLRSLYSWRPTERAEHRCWQWETIARNSIRLFEILYYTFNQLSFVSRKFLWHVLFIAVELYSLRNSIICLILRASYLAYSSTLKVEAIYFSERYRSLRTTRRPHSIFLLVLAISKLLNPSVTQGTAINLLCLFLFILFVVS
jgi:hypothetical protein